MIHQKIILTAGILSLLLVTGCKKDNPGPAGSAEPIDLITVTTDPDFDPEIPDHWVVVHDKDGKLLEYAVIQKGGTVKLTTTKNVPGNVISVTFIAHDVSSWNYHRMTSYTDISPGISWSLVETDVATNPATDGQFDLTVTNCPTSGGEMPQIAFVSPTPTLSMATNYPTFTATAAHITGVRRYFLSMTDGNQVLHYKFLDNVDAGNATNLSYSDLSTPTHTVKFTFPSSENSGMNCSGVSSINGLTYGVQSIFSFTPSSSITTSLLDEFATYSLIVYAEYDKMSYQYSKFGPPPAGDYALPTTATFNITSSSCKNFAISDAPSFNIRVSHWEKYSSGANAITLWTVNSPSSTQKFAEFPNEILTLLPDISIDDILYSDTQMYVQSGSYAGYLDIIRTTNSTSLESFGSELLIVEKTGE